MVTKENFYYLLRPILGTVVFIVIFIYGRPSFINFILSIPPVLIGEYIRVLAASSGKQWQRSYKLMREEVIDEGIYEMMRHPFYVGNFLIINGFLIFFGVLFFLYALIFLLSFLYFITLAKVEEKYLGEKVDYKSYKKQVPFFSFRLEASLNKRGIKQEFPTLLICLLVYIAGIMKIFFL